MNVTIEDQHLPDGPLGDQPDRAVGKIVEHTIAGAMPVMRVMRATGAMTGQPMPERLSRREKRAIDRQKGPVGENLTPGQAKNAKRRGFQRAACHGVDIGRRLRRPQIGPPRRFPRKNYRYERRPTGEFALPAAHRRDTYKG